MITIFSTSCYAINRHIFWSSVRGVLNGARYSCKLTNKRLRHWCDVAIWSDSNKQSWSALTEQHEAALCWPNFVVCKSMKNNKGRGIHAEYCIHTSCINWRGSSYCFQEWISQASWGIMKLVLITKIDLNRNYSTW